MGGRFCMNKKEYVCKFIDLNCDLGESYGNFVVGNDKEIMKYISSCNIACGLHSGDHIVMKKTVRMAIENGVSIGAHPGFNDIFGFGRREITISHEELEALIIYQLGALDGFVRIMGGKINHVKPHGAMYNFAARDYQFALTVVKAIKMYDDNLIFVGLSGSKMIDAANEIGLKSSSEVFADRAYNCDGSLVSRKKSNSIIYDESECVKRVIKMVKFGKVDTIDNSEIKIKADTICIHGDNEKAVCFAKRINRALNSENIMISRMTGVYHEVEGEE